VESRPDADRVKVSVFQWLGPLNVPDHSKYEYTAAGGMPGMGNSLWVSPTGGSIDGSQEGDTTADQVRIKWNGGPAVGKAAYQASPNYTWDLEVNVVEVVIENPPGEPAFETGTPCDGGLSDPAGRPDGLVQKIVLSDFSQGIRWYAKVTLNGPNGNRGVKFMRVASVQVATATQYWGDYQTAEMTLTSSLQGVAYPDCVTEQDRPYYRNDEDATFFNPMTGEYTNWKILTGEDAPSGGPPLQFDGTDDVVDVMCLVWTFDLYITAQTADNRNNAFYVYTARASAQWQFKGSGTVGQSDPYNWTPTDAAVTVLRGWTPETSGSEAPFVHTTETRFNEALRTDTWQ